MKMDFLRRLKRCLQVEDSQRNKEREEKELRKMERKKARQIEFEKAMEEMSKRLERLDKEHQLLKKALRSWHIPISKGLRWPIKKIMKKKRKKKRAENSIKDEEEDLWAQYAAIEEEWNSKVGDGKVTQEEEELIKIEEENENEVSSELVSRLDNLVMGEEEFEVQEDKEETSRSLYFVYIFSLDYVCVDYRL